MVPTRRSPKALLFFSLLASTSMASAANISFDGSFNMDDDVQFFSFSLSAPSSVTLSTLSYGGGTNAQGNTIAAGGFQPILSLFSGGGTLLDSSGANGNCPGSQNADPSTSLCVDAFVQAPGLSAGTYFVGLTQFFNIANGPTIGDGFLQAGRGNFTGPEICSDGGGSFLDETCSQRTNRYSLDIAGVDSAQQLSGVPAPIPEPSTGLLMLAPLALLYFRKAAQRRS